MNDNEIKTLVNAVTESYGGGLNGESSSPGRLPSRDEVAEIITLLRRLIFPGYFDDTVIDTPETEGRVRDLLIETEHRLRRQIALALRLETGAGQNTYERAGELCGSFLERLPVLRGLLATDVQATFDGDPAARSVHEIIFAYPGIFAITVFRLAHELFILDVPLIPRMMTEHAHSLTGVDIHPGASIGHHFCIDHGTGIVIGETTEIGAYVKLYQGVTLGALSTRGGQVLRGKKRHPTLEDEVTVYSGASILGGDTVIGKGSVIGGNTFIIQSVSPNTSVSIKKPELDFKLRDIERKSDKEQNHG